MIHNKKITKGESAVQVVSLSWLEGHNQTLNNPKISEIDISIGLNDAYISENDKRWWDLAERKVVYMWLGFIFYL